MSDLIKREDAIEAIEELPNAYNGWSDAYDKAYVIGALEEVPSADRPQGEWLDYNGKPTAANYSGTCSVCGTWSEYLLNYCPYCGAKMKGADDD